MTNVEILTCSVKCLECGEVFNAIPTVGVDNIGYASLYFDCPECQINKEWDLHDASAAAYAAYLAKKECP